MLHSSILSIASGTPTINIAYDEKNFAFFELMNIPQYCISAHSFDVGLALSVTLQALERSSGIAEMVKQRIEELRPELEVFLQDVAVTMAVGKTNRATIR